jgi:hypothetical protein
MDPRTIARAYGAICIGAGLWPVVQLRSFEAVTGPKVDGWLVKTVGLLLTGIGSVLVAGSRRPEVAREVLDLGLVTSGSLLAIDVWYASRGRISRIYLLDAILQGASLLGFARARREREA